MQSEVCAGRAKLQGGSSVADGCDGVERDSHLLVRHYGDGRCADVRQADGMQVLAQQTGQLLGKVNGLNWSLAQGNWTCTWGDA